jgi:endonuclease/exonuclease/phosphatase family metal-dependent hydrolase
MTYNIWNFNRGHNWNIRVKMIAEIVNQTDPGIPQNMTVTYFQDILAVQELRDDWKDQLPNQIDDLTAALPQYRYWRYTPAQIYLKAQAEEGIGILSKYPFLLYFPIKKRFFYCLFSDKIHKLPLVGVEDGNQRILVKMTMKHPFGSVDVFTTHWSFDPLAQMNQSEEAINIMQNYTGRIQLLLGDLNIFSNFEEPAELLICRGIFFEFTDRKSGRRVF